MEICHVATEYAPLVKVGGLADVTFGLSRQLAHLGYNVEVILPYYSHLILAPLEGLRIVHNHFHDHAIWQGKTNGVTITLIAPLHNDYFKRGQVYGEKDDLLRFGTFCHIVHHYLLHKKHPPIVHLHDWHTALVALLNQQRHYPILYTIHNLAYMGECDASCLAKLKIPLHDAQEIKAGDQYNLMKAGILYANHITTVSRTYAYEITHTAMGGILQNTLYNQREKLTGIVNGIDAQSWDPAIDPLLPYHFSAQQKEDKAQLKAYVKERFKLSAKKNFLACSITRLVPQKGPLLILEAIKEVLAQGGSYILLGSVADPAIEAQFKELGQHKGLYLQFVYDEALSHLIFAASDLFVMPSLFEPCGLTQLIALKYGAVPLVRETGGLKDTVFEGKNGFSFKEALPDQIRKTVVHAFTLWERDPKSWEELVNTGMRENHSWENSTKEYLSLYARQQKMTYIVD